MASHHSTLPGLRLKVRGKCFTLDGVRSVIGDLDDWELQALLEDGRLSWAINIASESAAARELRIPACCLDDYEASRKRDYTVAEMVEYLFGPASLIRARPFYRALNFKHSHFYTLVQEKVIRLAKGCTHRRGPGGGAIVTRLDAVAFLTARRVL